MKAQNINHFIALVSGTAPLQRSVQAALHQRRVHRHTRGRPRQGHLWQKSAQPQSRWSQNGISGSMTNMLTDPALPHREARCDGVHILCKRSQHEPLTYMAPSYVPKRTGKIRIATYMVTLCVPKRTQKDSLDRHVHGTVAILAQALPSTIEMPNKGLK